MDSGRASGSFHERHGVEPGFDPVSGGNRGQENEQTDKPDRGQGTVALPDMRRGKIGICVATQIARYVKPSNNLQGYSPEQAWAQTQGQLSWYRAMEERGELLN